MRRRAHRPGLELLHRFVMYGVVLLCIVVVLYCVVLCCIVLYCVVFCCTVLHCVALFVLLCNVWYEDLPSLGTRLDHTIKLPHYPTIKLPHYPTIELAHYHTMKQPHWPEPTDPLRARSGR